MEISRGHAIFFTNPESMNPDNFPTKTAVCFDLLKIATIKLIFYKKTNFFTIRTFKIRENM